ncbi:hypothetical protein T265_14385 [Opisthorchis viverrini]|uniref:Uncharacterized protein n=2 Tax=Opisthorchis viverrini TaxID=6198 RepID=A0A074ZMK8_OPIVI|nr:hypothetical protein T265_14385 [Opisthorchis viverrini]KER24595.1 hypothetical protein T265_14385 [Opisthorchis viverrini]
MSELSAPPSVSDFTIKCVESKQLFAAVESNDKDEFLKLYSELPPRSRPHVWQLRKSDRGDTLVHIGARLGLSWLVGLAVSENADVALHSHHNKQPLHDAAQTGAAECVKILLCSNRLPVDPLKRADWTPLMLACAASANKLDQQIMISTPSLHRFTDCVELLLQHGADPSFTNKDGWNCLHVAVRAASPSIVSRLLKHSPNTIFTRTSNGRTVLHCLACCQTPSPTDVRTVAQLILERAPSLRFLPDNCGTLPVFDALRRGLLCLVDVLLQVDAVKQLTARDIMGQQATHMCSETGQLECLELVINHLGPRSLTSPVPSDSSSGLAGAHPLHLACRSGQHRIVSYIIDLWMRTQNSVCPVTDWLLPLDCVGRSPFHYAAFGTAGWGAVHREDRLLCIKLICDHFLHHCLNDQQSSHFFRSILIAMLEIQCLDPEFRHQFQKCLECSEVVKNKSSVSGSS